MNMTLILLGLLLIWNVVVFITYAIDKYKAVHQLWRIPEKVLLTQAVIGGGLGAILAGRIVHHKTRKWYFWTAWILGLFIDLALLYAIFQIKK